MAQGNVHAQLNMHLIPGVNGTIYHPQKATRPRYDSSTWSYLWKRWAVWAGYSARAESL